MVKGKLERKFKLVYEGRELSSWLSEAGKYDAHTIGVRPEHIDVVESGGQWKGTVGVAEHLGSDTFFHIHNTGLAEMVTVRAIGDVSLTHGDTIHLTPKAGEIHRFDSGGLRIA